MTEKEKDMPHVCEMCEHAKDIRSDDNMLCERHGVVGRGYSCGKFRYDPLKRIPSAPRMPDIPDESEFTV